VTHRTLLLVSAGLMLIVTASAGNQPGEAAESALVNSDAATALTQRLSIEHYKATIKGLTQLGDRREGTRRNRDAINWIEVQLRSYGCLTARLKYTYAPPPLRPNPRVPSEFATSGGRLRGIQAPTPPNLNQNDQPNPKLRNLNSEVPEPGPREEVYCTKTGSAHPAPANGSLRHLQRKGFPPRVQCRTDNACGSRTADRRGHRENGKIAAESSRLIIS
jgi:hypothetical protein